MGQLNLRVLIQVIDRATSPLRSLSGRLSGLRRPAEAANRVINALSRDLRGLGRAAKWGLGAVGLSALTSAAGLMVYINQTTAAGEAALLASQKTGVQIESYQRLQYAAGLAEVATEEFDNGLKFLNVSIDAAGRGSKQDARAFATLGVSLRDARGQLKPTEQLFLEIADKMAKMPDGAQKTAVAMAIFGRSGTEMIPLLNQGGEAIRKLGDDAQKAGLVLSEKAARDADAFNDAMDKARGAVRGLGMTVVTGLLPNLLALVERTNAWIDANRPEIIEKVNSVLAKLGEILPPLLKGFWELVTALGDLAKFLGPIIQALGGFHDMLDFLAVLMIGRVAIAIWSATAAVWGLNGAMLANPVGLVIAGIAALVVAGWLLARNWRKVWESIKAGWSGLVRTLRGVWGNIRDAFSRGVSAVWNSLPAWFRVVLRAGAFVVRWAFGGGRPPPGQPGGVGGAGPRPATPKAVTVDAGGTVRIEVDDRRTRARGGSNDARITYDVGDPRRGEYS